MNYAPNDSTCYLTAGRVSNPRTIAPKDLAVAIAAKPATPPPMTKILAGGSFPAAVICPVKNLPKFSAAIMTALYPAIFAIDDKASKVWALVILGIWSIANDVIPLWRILSTKSLFCPGYRNEIKVEPYLMWLISWSPKVGFYWGGLIFKTTSDEKASLAETIFAPELI